MMMVVETEKEVLARRARYSQKAEQVEEEAAPGRSPAGASQSERGLRMRREAPEAKAKRDRTHR